LKKEIKKFFRRIEKQDLILELGFGSLRAYILTSFSLVIKSMLMSTRARLIVSLQVVLRAQVRLILVLSLLKKELKT